MSTKGCFYRGPLVLDGAPIVAVATLASSNIKTGSKEGEHGTNVDTPRGHVTH